MKLLLSRQFAEYIWHIVPAGTGLLALELRSADQMDVRFVVVNLTTKEQVAYESSEITWWTSLVDWTNDGIILRRYNDDKDPSKNQFFRLSAAGDFESVETYDLPPSKGEFPSFYDTEGSSFQTVASFLRGRGIEPIAGVEYTEWANVIVLGYYTSSGNLLDRHLLVVDKDGSDVLHLKIDTGMQGVVFESFFTFTDYLVFVNERKELNVYRA